MIHCECSHERRNKNKDLNNRNNLCITKLPKGIIKEQNNQTNNMHSFVMICSFITFIICFVLVSLHFISLKMKTQNCLFS